MLTFAGDGRKTLQGTLAAEGLDLTPYVSTVRLLTGSERNWNRRPIALDGLNGVDVDLRLSAARVTIGIRQARAHRGRRQSARRQSDGRDRRIAGLRRHASRARSGSPIRPRRRPQGADCSSPTSISSNASASSSACAGSRARAISAFSLDSSGASVYDLTKALNGTATLTSRKGAIAGVNVEQFLRRLERSPLSGRGDLRGGKTPYDLLAINLKITQGTASVEDVRIEAPAVRLALAGSASIPARELDLKGTASPAGERGRRAPPPSSCRSWCRGRGTIRWCWPDPQSLINRSGAAAPLLDAVRNRLKREPRRQPQAATPPAAAARTGRQPTPAGANRIVRGITAR